MFTSERLKQDDSSPQTQLQSAGQLTIDAIIALTDIAESIHYRVHPFTKFPCSHPTERTSSLTGLVYRSIRSISALVEKGLNFPLGAIDKNLDDICTSSQDKMAFVSALNGVLGDHLAERSSPLAIEMTLNQTGQCVTPSLLAESLRQSNGRLVIMVHGLCMNHLQWSQGDHDHGLMLAKELGVTVVYLLYNSGLNVYNNGAVLSHLLEHVVKQVHASESTLTLDISIIAHSMGGLVSRSATYQAPLLGHDWPKVLNKMVFLGTPHHGAPLEKAGSWLDLLLGLHGYTAPLTRLTKIRSAGIRDLQHGSIVALDSPKQNMFDYCRDNRKPIDLPENVQCYTVATTASANPNTVDEQVIGDGLVPLDSALGKHKNPLFTLQFPTAHQWVGHNINHIQLLSNPDIYMTIKKWLLQR